MGLKIRRIYFRGFQQFEDTVLDFTDPATGEAADRVCLIGRNGTGKSTVLRLIADLWSNPKRALRNGIAIEVQAEFRRILLARPTHGANVVEVWDTSGCRDDIEELLDCEDRAGFDREFFDLLNETHAGQLPREAHLGQPDLLAYSPAEAASNAGLKLTGMPATSLNDALDLRTSTSFHHEISTQRIADMWRRLVYLVKLRDSDRELFERRPENLDKTKQRLIDEFDAEHPEILAELGGLWNKILEPAGLEFDVAGAQIPVQLTDNLVAHIRLRGTGEHLPFNQLSTGTRNFLFRVGHLFLLYFDRTIERGLVLIDEPENSLFPDFLFELMEVYDEIVRGPDGRSSTQLFFATHNPIVAAQFHPHERVVLEWDETRHVVARKGMAPKGDDPNDVLRKDFHLDRLMGAEGLKQWREYQRLRKQIRRAKPEDREELVTRAADIAVRYGFEPDDEAASA